MLAHGRCLKLLENRPVGGAACGDVSRAAVASNGRLPVQAGGGAANPFSFKRNLFLEDAPEKDKKSKEED